MGELAIIKKSDYAITSRVEELREIYAANMGNSKLTMSDLEIVKIPSGGAQNWTINSFDGEKQVPAITGVVVMQQDRRAYWPKSMDDGGASDPDCKSDNCVIGEGNPGGACKTCPFAQWDSGKNGGQACKVRRLLFMLRPDDLLPMIVVLSATSIKHMRKYNMRLMTKQLPIYGVETKLELGLDTQKLKNGGVGNKYSYVKPTVVRVLDKEAMAAIKVAVESLLPTLEKTDDLVDA